MEDSKRQYLLLLSDIIAKQAIILGSEMAILKARSIAGLVVDNNGQVTDIRGDATQAAQKLINSYMELAGQVVRNAIDPIFAKYPQIYPVK